MALFTNFYKKNQNLLNKRFFIVALILFPYMFRQGIYRLIITYRIKQERIADTQLDAKLERYILTHPDIYDRQFDDVDKIIHVSLKLTAEILSFKGESGLKTDPLSTFRIGETNSEGYAAFFNAVCTYLIRRYHFSDEYICRQYIAERIKGGVNLQDAFQSPYGDSGVGAAFNKTRDVVGILETRTGQYRYIDPTIYDQCYIVDINVVGATTSFDANKPHLKKRI